MHRGVCPVTEAPNVKERECARARTSAMHLGEDITTATGLRLSVHKRCCSFTFHAAVNMHTP